MRGKQEQPPDVFFHIAGMYKALHQQEAEDRKGQPSGEAQHHVQPVQRIGGKGVPREGAAVQPGVRIPASMQDAPMWSTSMVMQAMVLRAVPLEAAARGKCGHKKHLGQFVKNRYKNYNGGKVAFPASAAAKSAQSMHKSAQNA